MEHLKKIKYAFLSLMLLFSIATGGNYVFGIAKHDHSSHKASCACWQCRGRGTIKCTCCWGKGGYYAYGYNVSGYYGYWLYTCSCCNGYGSVICGACGGTGGY